MHFSYFSVSILNFRSFLSHFIFLSAIYFVFFLDTLFQWRFSVLFSFFLFISQSFGRHQLFSAKGVDNCIQPIELLLWRFLRTFFGFLSLASFYELTFKLDTILVFKESFDLVVKHNSLPSPFDTFLQSKFLLTFLICLKKKYFCFYIFYLLDFFCFIFLIFIFILRFFFSYNSLLNCHSVVLSCHCS